MNCNLRHLRSTLATILTITVVAITTTPSSWAVPFSVTGAGGLVPDNDASGITFDVAIPSGFEILPTGDNATLSLLGITHSLLFDLITGTLSNQNIINGSGRINATLNNMASGQVRVGAGQRIHLVSAANHTNFGMIEGLGNPSVGGQAVLESNGPLTGNGNNGGGDVQALGDLAPGRESGRDDFWGRSRHGRIDELANRDRRIAHR